MHDLMLVCCLVGIFGAVEGIEHWTTKHKAMAKRMLWLFACLSHPITLKTIEEFLIHFVLYSGRLIAP